MVMDFTRPFDFVFIQLQSSDCRFFKCRLINTKPHCLAKFYSICIYPQLNNVMADVTGICCDFNSVAHWSKYLVILNKTFPWIQNETKWKSIVFFICGNKFFINLNLTFINSYINIINIIIYSFSWVENFGSNKT